MKVNGRFNDEMRRRLLGNLKVKQRDLVRYFKQRDINPMIQAQWEAMTVVDRETRTIKFPNGITQHY